MLRIGAEGVCSAHIVFHLGDEETNISEIKAALEQTLTSWDSRKRPSPISGPPTFLSIAGPCDLTLRLRLHDLRFAFLLQSRLVNLQAQASTWTFSVPYDYVSQKPSLQSPQSPSLEFITYLRVARPAYRKHGSDLETRLVTRIRSILDQADIAGEIHYCLGWADLAIHGACKLPVQSLLQALLQLESFSLPTASVPSNVLVRAFTLIGMPRPQESTGPDVRPLVLIRALPGRLLTTIDAFRQQYSSVASRAYVLDGRWDAALSFDDVIPLGDFVRRLHSEAPSLRDAGLERSETHVLALPLDGDHALEQPAIVFSDLPTDEVTNECGCRKPLPDIESTRGLLHKDGLLPESLAVTASTSLALLAYSLRDSSNCCELRQPVEACLNGIRRLIQRLDEVHGRTLETTGTLQSQWFDALNDLRADVREWCRNSRRVLQERTAGSFDEYFRHSHTVSTYRGGMQKALFIADNLLHSFYRRLPAELMGTEPQPVFATVFKSGESISSIRLTGLVRIPVRYAFSIHILLPQLWHEVVQLCFHRDFALMGSRSPFLNERFAALRSKLVEKGIGEMPDDEIGRIQQLLSDMFADVVVFHVGFRCDLACFIRFLATLEFESMLHRRLSQNDVARHWQMLFLRILYVTVYDTLVREAPDDDLARSGRALCASAAERVTPDVSRWLSAIASEPNYAELNVPAELLSKTFEFLETAVYQQVMEPILDDLAKVLRREPRQPSPPRRIPGTALYSRRPLSAQLPDQIRDGYVMVAESSDAVTDWYFAAYLEELHRLARAPRHERPEPDFRTQAALARSAMLTFLQDSGAAGE